MTIQHRPGKARRDPQHPAAPTLMIPIFKLPVLLYRLGLGWLLGTRFLQLTHLGRRSGKPRRTVLAVLRFDQDTGAIYAVSAWHGSDWYANIQAVPALSVETGSIRYVPVQRTLSPQEITSIFLNYCSRGVPGAGAYHPRGGIRAKAG